MSTQEELPPSHSNSKHDIYIDFHLHCLSGTHAQSLGLHPHQTSPQRSLRAMDEVTDAPKLLNSHHLHLQPTMVITCQHHNFRRQIQRLPLPFRLPLIDLDTGVAYLVSLFSFGLRGGEENEFWDGRNRGFEGNTIISSSFTIFERFKSEMGAILDPSFSRGLNINLNWSPQPFTPLHPPQLHFLLQASVERIRSQRIQVEKMKKQLHDRNTLLKQLQRQVRVYKTAVREACASFAVCVCVCVYVCMLLCLCVDEDRCCVYVRVCGCVCVCVSFAVIFSSVPNIDISLSSRRQRRRITVRQLRIWRHRCVAASSAVLHVFNPAVSLKRFFCVHSPCLMYVSNYLHLLACSWERKWPNN